MSTKKKIVVKVGSSLLANSDNLTLREVVLVLRPLCGPVKVDQGFISGCNSHRLCFGRIGLVGGQDAMGRVRSFGIVIGQPFSDAAAGL